MNTAQLENSGMLLSHTSVSNVRSTGHQNGGVAMLASRDLLSMVSDIVSTNHGISFSVFGESITTLYLPPSLNLSAVTAILDRIDTCSMLLGDFNTRLGAINGDTIVTNRPRGQAIQSFANKHGLRFQPTSDGTRSRTDHLYTSRQTAWTYTPTQAQSDHGVMNIELEVQVQAVPETHPDKIRYLLKDLKSPVVQSQLRKHWELGPNDVVYRGFQSAIESCRSDSLGPHSYQTIVDTEYANFVDELRLCISEHVREYQPSLSKFRPSSLDSENLGVLTAIRTFKRTMRSSFQRTQLLSRDPQVTASQETKAYYSSMFESRTPPPSSMIRSKTPLNEILKFDEVLTQWSIDQYSATKAPGSDCLPAMLFKALGRSKRFISTLACLFQLLAASQTVPSAWNQVNVHLLFKDRSTPYADKTRPIALSQILRRLFEKCNLKIWRSDRRPWTKLNNYQAGFRKGYSTTSHVLLTDELSKTGYGCSTFLDLKGAYDSVPWDILINLLVSKGCPMFTVNLLRGLMCTPASLNIQINDSESVKVYTYRGLFQGSLLSPLLFSIFIDPLAAKLNSLDCIAPFFADDILIKTKSPQAAQPILNECFTWGEENSMEWNIGKCGVVGNGSDVLTLGREPVPEVSSYKYLGAPHDAAGIDWLESCIRQTKAHDQMLLTLNDSSSAWHPNTRRIVYRTFVRPILEYLLPLVQRFCCQLGPKNTLTVKITALFGASISKANLFIVGHHCSPIQAAILLGTGDFSFRSKMLMAGLSYHLRSLVCFNPLSSLRLQTRPYHRRSILERCWHHPWVTEYERLPVQNPQLSWKEYKNTLLQEEVDQEYKGNLKLTRYMCPLARNKDKSGIVFSWPKTPCSQALSWIFGKAYSTSSCICTQRFNRSHLATCISLQLPPIDELIYTQMQATFSASGFQHYTRLDYCCSSNGSIEMFKPLWSTFKLALD